MSTTHYLVPPGFGLIIPIFAAVIIFLIVSTTPPKNIRVVGKTDTAQLRLEGKNSIVGSSFADGPYVYVDYMETTGEDSGKIQRGVFPENSITPFPFMARPKEWVWIDSANCLRRLK